MFIKRLFYASERHLDFYRKKRMKGANKRWGYVASAREAEDNKRIKAKLGSNHLQQFVLN